MFISKLNINFIYNGISSARRPEISFYVLRNSDFYDGKNTAA